MRVASSVSFAILLALPLAAQVPTQRDSTARDSARVLPELTVTVTRAQERVSRVPAAVSVVDQRDVKGAQSTLGLDESLNNLPGVYVANRYNFNLDQRLVIRGFGTRSNFGLRGIKVMLDGIPQTLPDGQSQLTNVDYANLGRVEVLRGASSSLYGNASGGVVSLTTEPAGPGPFAQSIRAQGGSFGLFRIQSRTTARRGPASGTLSISRTSADGSRQWSRSEFTQLNLGGDYLLGPEAGHANWTGQSGLATKTSHAVFLLSAVFQRLRAEGKSVAALMFNVKGPDLLWLDKPAIPEPEWAEAYAEAKARTLSEQDLEAYAALGLEPKPFENVRIFAPFKPGEAPGRQGQLDVQLERLTGTFSGKLNTDRDTPAEAEGVVFPILWPLQPLLWMPHKVFEWGDLDDKLSGFIYDLRNAGIESFNQLDAKFAEIRDYFAGEGSGESWNGHHKMTIAKAENRFKSLPDKFGGLVSRSMVEYGGLPKVDEPFHDQELRVVDIADCNSAVQEILVTRVVDRVWKMAEEQKLGVETVIIFVDELNKYAPAGGQGGLRDTLVDIAARGRHLNVVLFGAEQFRSKVDSEILGNCGTSFYGRVGDEELTNAAYRSLSETTKHELLGLRKGTILARHAHFRAPLFGTFPLKPTIDGMMGQRIFNPAQDGIVRGHVGDGLFKTLHDLMGDRAPRKQQVRTETMDLNPQTMADIVRQINGIYGGRPLDGRADPWRKAQELMAKARSRL
mgnify:CR=1 FL=1